MLISYIAIFIIGSLFGSFFYTLAVRFINGSVERNAFYALFSVSRCPHCNERINPLFLIPLLGYLLTKGKCRKCGSNISWEYPAFEVLFGLLALIICRKSGLNFYSADIFLLLSISITISIIDIKTKIIPNSLVAVFLLLSIYPVILSASLKDNLYGFLLMAVFFAVVLLIFPGSFGGGDLKFASVMGILLGFESSIVALEVSLVTGSVIGLIYALKSKKGLRIKIPFAPFLTAGLFVSLFCARDIIAVYYRIFF
ncbi:MAG: prepilin peptidase [Spirochaetes bacterium]|nr:prepilin peptidase [Spirochaetota bacterium]